MANYRQLRLEWSMIRTDADDWSQSDLQLAAELGKTLLERNKELEAALRHHQNVVDDQAQEIEYLRKQTAALREVNDSRLRIYEQLEVSIQELEVSNHRLSSQNNQDKKHISSLESQIERLEGRCEELERRLEEERMEAAAVAIATLQRPHHQPQQCSHSSATSYVSSEQAAAMREELTELKAANAKLSTKVKQLQSTIDTVTQENMRLEERLIVMQHRQEEMAVVDQVRQGDVCSRCLRSQEEISLTGDEDDVSVIDSLMNDDHIKESLGELDNPYRTLVEKYEALLMVQQRQQQHPGGLYRPPNHQTTMSADQPMSLQEELAMSGEFFHREEDDGDIMEEMPPHQKVSDLSETSSGFSDETINKGTQTEAIPVPGSFLCSITDGDDCKFSIYDEANAVDSRFRKTPEYRRLFREIFDVLKRAAEAKDEGETLPLLEDMTPVTEAPPVTPHEEQPPSKDVQEQQPTRRKKDILESLAQGLGGGGGGGGSRKSRRRHRNATNTPPSPPTAPASSSELPPEPQQQPTSKSQKRRQRALRGASGDSGRSTPQQQEQPWFTSSSASQEVAKLKQLEKSYAEVLRLGRERVNRK